MMTAPRNNLYEGARIAAPEGHNPLPTLYWSERDENVGWWSGIPTRCTRTCGGVLDAVPPGATTSRGPGVVVCTKCSREVAWIAEKRLIRVHLTAADFAPRRTGRPPKPKIGRPVGVVETKPRPRQLTPMTCRWCAVTFQPRKAGQVFCTRVCKDTSGRKTADRTCAVCGKGFRPQSRTSRQRFCSSTCLADVRRREPPTIDCAWCGQTVIRADSTQRFCGRSCSARAAGHARSVGGTGG